MNSYIDLITTKLIGEKQNVIIYGSDVDALLVIKALEHRHHARPTCLCDSDGEKRHKNFIGVSVLSPEEAISLYPDAFFFIAKGFYKFQAIGNLLMSGKVPADRILNYEPVEKRTSCIYLESYIICTGHKLYYCCSDFGKNQSPSVSFDGDYEKAAEDFITYRDQLISDLNQGIPTPCDGCPGIKEDWYASDRKIMIFNDGEEGICNFNCCYCVSPAKASKSVLNDINAGNLLNVFKKLDFLSDELHTIISCGEICVHPRRGEIYDAINDSRNTLCTNASVCDKRITRLLESGNTDLIVSIDAGTRSTFMKIKGYDLFDKVCNNLKNYSKAGEVRMKYILLPEMNDNEADIDGFISLCKEIGANLVQVSYNLYAPAELTEKTAKLAKHFVNRLSENGIKYRVISDVISRSLAYMETAE